MRHFAVLAASLVLVGMTACTHGYSSRQPEPTTAARSTPAAAAAATGLLPTAGAVAARPVPSPSPAPTTSPSLMQAYDLSFVDPLDGWALGTYYPCGFSGGQCPGQPRIWQTSDGGQSWLRLPDPVVAAGVSVKSERHLLFISQQDGLLYGPGLYVTHDGGKTWSGDYPDAVWIQLAPVGRSIWALVSPCQQVNGPSCADAGTLMVSADAGRTWQTPANQPSVHAGAMLVAPETGEVWLFGLGIFWADAVPLFRTSDAGQNWNLVGLAPCGRLFTALAGGRIWLVCRGQYTGGWEFQRSLSVSDDGGLSWHEVVSRAMGGPGYSVGFAAVSRDRAYIIGGRAGLLQSDDGGATWQTVIGDTGGNGFAAVTFIDASHGWALHLLDTGDPPGTIGTVWRTSDGGTTWAGVRLP